MVQVIKDEREWQVAVIMDNEACPHLYYPANIHACDYEDPKQLHAHECNKDACPLLLKQKQRRDE